MEPGELSNGRTKEWRSTIPTVEMWERKHLAGAKVSRADKWGIGRFPRERGGGHTNCRPAPVDCGFIDVWSCCWSVRLFLLLSAQRMISIIECTFIAGYFVRSGTGPPVVNAFIVTVIISSIIIIIIIIATPIKNGRGKFLRLASLENSTYLLPPSLFICDLKPLPWQQETGRIDCLSLIDGDDDDDFPTALAGAFVGDDDDDCDADGVCNYC